MHKKSSKKMTFQQALKQIDKQTRQKWEKEQNELKKKITLKNNLDEKLEYICGMDLTFSKHYPEIAIASTIIINNKFELIGKYSKLYHIEVPYVPSFLAFREVDPMIETYNILMKILKEKNPEIEVDLIFVDGNGILHPRECGLGVHLGVSLNKPTIGCAKTIFAIDGIQKFGLYKEIKQRFKELDDKTTFEYLKGNSGKIWGAAVKNTSNSYVPLIVSVGNMIDIDKAIKLVYQFSKTRVVEPVRLADKESRKLMQKFEKFVKNKKISEFEALKTFKICNQF